MKRWLVKDKNGKTLTVWGYVSQAISSAWRRPGATVVQEWDGKTVFRSHVKRQPTAWKITTKSGATWCFTDEPDLLQRAEELGMKIIPLYEVEK